MRSGFRRQHQASGSAILIRNSCMPKESVQATPGNATGKTCFAGRKSWSWKDQSGIGIGQSNWAPPDANQLVRADGKLVPWSLRFRSWGRECFMGYFRT